MRPPDSFLPKDVGAQAFLRDAAGDTSASVVPPSRSKAIEIRPVRPILLALMTLIAPQLGFAQQAPTGAHYGGRATDTGYGGSLVNSAGVYSTSIPLDLPAERAGLPVPLQISYGTRGVGAAGLGWDIPFSYIRREFTFAHHRPAITQASDRARGRVPFFHSLGPAASWCPMVMRGLSAPVRSSSLCVKVAACSWPMMAPAAPIRSRQPRITQPRIFGNAGLWLLNSVSTAGGASVQLTYEYRTYRIDGRKRLEVSLTRIAYNTSPITGCAKHEIVLTYGDSSTSPLSISMLDDIALVRFRTLTQVDVTSRANCDTLPEVLRSYLLKYLTDGEVPRHRLPRLKS